jgi:3-oxoacyl-[acyl-carrier protein] reductase
VDFQIAGKKALVCAASKGLGKAIAIALAKEGVELLLTARSQELLQAAASEAKSAGSPNVSTHVCDLTDEAARSNLIEFAKKQLKHVDILIHNVGGPKPTTAL